MKVLATFSEGMGALLEGAAIGDEFEISARVRVVGADEALVEISGFGGDVEVAQGELEVRLLLSHPRRA